MTNSKNKKRKQRNSSDNEQNSGKVHKQRGPSAESGTDNVAVSEVLNLANSVLYGDHCVSDNVFVNTVPTEADIQGEIAEMADSGSSEPTNRDLMNILKAMCARLEIVEKKLGSIEVIEKRIGGMEKDMKNLWMALDERMKKVDERVQRVEDKVDGADIHSAQMISRIDELEKEREALRDDVSYLQSQSMRNNLVFAGVSEDNSNGNEVPEITERKLRQHLVDAFHIAQEIVDSIRFERVHRSPGAPVVGKIRNIVSKFTYFKDREMVRKRWKELDGTVYRVFEQFPQDVVQKRRKLVTKMKEARRQGKRAYLAYDTLYIDGVPQRA
jgi:chromosome segregation ATPase